MKKAKHLNKQKRKFGRPRTTGVRTQISLRCHAEFFERVDAWQADKAPDLSRPQAFRRLAEIGLDREGN